jgi:hypothetical protein
MECDNQPKHCGGLSLLCPSDSPDICAQILAIPKGKKGMGDGFHNHVSVTNNASHEIHPLTSQPRAMSDQQKAAQQLKEL